MTLTGPTATSMVDAIHAFIHAVRVWVWIWNWIVLVLGGCCWVLVLVAARCLAASDRLVSLCVLSAVDYSLCRDLGR